MLGLQHVVLGGIILALSAGVASAQSAFPYLGAPVPIPDGLDLSGAAPGMPVVAPVTVSGFTLPVGKVVVSIDGALCDTTVGSTTVGIDHSFVNDLRVRLRSPGGTVVTVIQNTDGSGNNLCQVVLDDDSVGPSIQSVVTANAPFTGTYTPANPLSVFAGETANGVWELEAQDYFSYDTGSIRAWTVTITEAAPPPVVVPTLTEWAMLMLGGLLALAGAVVVTRRRPV